VRVGGGGEGETLTFYYNQDNREINDWGFSAGTTLYKGKNAKQLTVPLLDIARFVNEHVADQGIRTVLMKLDVEGSEYAVLPRMFSLGAFEHIDMITAEFHQRMCPITLKTTTGTRTYQERDCADLESLFPVMLAGEFGTLMQFVDNEQYRWDGKPLPA